MDSAKCGQLQLCGAATLALGLLLLSSCQPCGVTGGLGSCTDTNACVEKGKVCTVPTVHALARDLDELQEHIEKYGSIVASQPSVWGQARLTKHRDEYEQQMAAELGNFSQTLQGSVNGSDQAYLADAFALSAAASGQAPAAVASSKGGAAASSSGSSSAAAPGVAINIGTSAPASSPSSPSSSGASSALQPLPFPDQSSTFGAFANISRTPVQSVPALQFAAAKGGITLEPTVYLDQKSRYLNHLHELRRINEGDDTADSPGYALNLVRFAVSVLPGKCTDVGHGAEVTMTITPQLSEELLPTVFRNLILNDLVDQLSLPATQFINDPNNLVYFDEKSVGPLEELIEYGRTGVDKMDPAKLGALRWNLSLQDIVTRPEWAWVDPALKLLEEKEGLEHSKKSFASFAKVKPFLNPQDFGKETQAKIKASQKEIEGKLADVAKLQHFTLAIPSTKSRRARLPFPPSQLPDVYGYDFLYHIALDTYRAFARERTSKPCTDSNQLYIHLPDVQSYLQEELAAAYKLLATPPYSDVLWKYCTKELATAIHTHQVQTIATMRKEFIATLAGVSMKDANAVTHSSAAAFAWGMIVESALLTDQLVEDMRESAAAKHVPCPHDGWLDYYHPQASPEARYAFNEYVKIRWPIHVFALDPAEQQQNLADTFSSRREMQLAMSLAFVSGNLNAKNMMEYARRIEFDFATIDLNGTAIGFSHGNDTFGWRFYPRFQTPDVDGNAKVFFRDLLVGGPNRNTLLKERRLEPGIRECYAVVIMPSFVPYATLNVSSDWFSLTNPKHKQLNSADAMRLSKAVKSIENCAPKVVDRDCYRDGDFERLAAKAKQLAARLPLQSTQVQVPYENTLGGFAMFNTGVTDLAPELTGWYGTSSIDPAQPTTLFLVGNHFSVHQTRVIAGGQEIANRELLSRQVMKVVVPAGAALLGDAFSKFVDVHIATPYGVTQHLLIPVCTPPAAGAAAVAKGVVWSSPTLDVAFGYAGVGIAAATDGTATRYRPTDLAIKAGDVDGAKYTSVDVRLSFDSKFGVGPIALNAVPYDATKNAYVIPLDTLVSDLFASFGQKFGPETTNPPSALTVTADLSFNAVGGGMALPRKIGNTLTINWIKSAGAGGAPKTPAPAATAAQAPAAAPGSSAQPAPSPQAPSDAVAGVSGWVTGLTTAATSPAIPTSPQSPPLQPTNAVSQPAVAPLRSQ